MVFKKLKQKWKRWRLPICAYCRERIEENEPAEKRWDLWLGIEIGDKDYYHADSFHKWCVKIAEQDSNFHHKLLIENPEEARKRKRREAVRKAKEAYLNGKV